MNTAYRVLMGAALLALAWTVTGCGGGGGGGGGGASGDRGRVMGVVYVNTVNGLEVLANATVSAGGVVTTTGTDGTFLLVDVPLSAQVGTITAPGYNTKTFSIVLTRAGEVYNAGNITVTINPQGGTTATISGVVIIVESGAFAAGATVSMGDQFQYKAYTDNQGRFTIAGVPIEARWIKVSGTNADGGWHGNLFEIGYALIAGQNNVGTLYVHSNSGPPPPPPGF